MYTPSHHQVSAAEMFEFVERNSFAVLVTNAGGKYAATHLPLLLRREANRILLVGHIARANGQWRDFAADSEVLAIFAGAHAYISSRWYDEPENNVPTWDYQAVHVTGKLQIVEDEAALREMFAELMGRYEGDSGYTLDSIAPDYVRKLTKAVVAFEITVTDIEANFKLHQHHRERSHYQNIIAELEKQADDNSLAVAAAMRANLGSER